MSQLSKSGQTENAKVLKNEIRRGANTKVRVYNLLQNLIDSSVSFDQIVHTTGNSLTNIVSQKGLSDILTGMTFGSGEGNYWKTSGDTTLTTSATITTDEDNARIQFRTSNVKTWLYIGEGTSGKTFTAFAGGSVSGQQVQLTMDLDGISPNGAGFYILDSRTTPKGLEYKADYSASFTNRSLIDRGTGDARYLPIAGKEIAGPFQLSSATDVTTGAQAIFEIGDTFVHPMNTGALEIISLHTRTNGYVPALAFKETARFGVASFDNSNTWSTYLEASPETLDTPGANYLKIVGLPTTNPNVANALWNDGGILKISAG